MRAVIQVVEHASVEVDGKIVGACKKGYLILLGVAPTDTEETAKQLWNKIYKLRICADDNGKTNCTLADVDGELLIVSQFTLYANCRKGNRPSFTDAAKPEHAKHLYEVFLDLARQDVAHVDSGIFGADMRVELVNQGPFTIILDTDDLNAPRRG